MARKKTDENQLDLFLELERIYTEQIKEIQTKIEEKISEKGLAAKYVFYTQAAIVLLQSVEDSYELSERTSYSLP